MNGIPIYLAMMLIALAAMGTNVYRIDSHGRGIEHAMPWLRRSSLYEALSRASAWVGACWRACRVAWRAYHRPALAAILLLAAVVHPAHAHALGVLFVGETLTELRDQRQKLVVDMRALLDKAEKEKRPLNTEERASFDKMKTDALALKGRIDDRADLETEERTIGAPSTQVLEHRTDADRTAYELRREGLVRFFRSQTTPEDRSMFLNGLRDGVFPDGGPGSIIIGGAPQPSVFDQRMRAAERRSQNTLTLAAGGALIAPDTSMYGRIIDALKFFGGMEAVGSTIITTDTGADLPIATDDDTSNTGAIVAEEATQAGATSVTMGQVVLHSYLYSSKVIKVSWQLLQDASFDLEGWIAMKLGMRLGRIQNTHYTTGTGVNQPQGVVTASTVGRQSATGNTVAATADDIIRLIRSVDIAYRNPNCRFMMSDATALVYELLKDGNGQYIWRNGSGFNGLNDRSADSLRGYPVVYNNDMPTMAASAKHTTFGDHSNYYIRRVRAIQLVRLNELYVENGQVGFLAFMRADGGLVDAGQHPVKALQNSAT